MHSGADIGAKGIEEDEGARRKNQKKSGKREERERACNKWNKGEKMRRETATRGKGSGGENGTIKVWAVRGLHRRGRRTSPEHLAQISEISARSRGTRNYSPRRCSSASKLFPDESKEESCIVASPLC